MGACQVMGGQGRDARRTRRPARCGNVQRIAWAALLWTGSIVGCQWPADDGPAGALRPARPAMPSATAGYVADSACRECHPEICDDFHGVGMGRSFDVRPIASAGEDFQDSHYFHPLTGLHYEMVREGEEIYQIRYQIDTQGRRKNELKVRVDAVIGSGNHARAYLHRAPSGELFQMPLAWYREDGRWRMNPGYDRPDHWGFQRKINRECMFCHNAFPLNVPATADDFWQPDVFPEVLPEGIGCQRCHGPGERHVRVASRGDATLEELQRGIINPARLPADRRDDVCNQCHLQPASLVSSVMVRMGRDDYSYRPGQPLDAYRAWIDYEDPAEPERFEINHHAYRLAQSRCFLGSGDRLACTVCHDPHRAVRSEDRAGHYRSRCLQCHGVEECGPAVELERGEDASRAGLADCVACHMPRRKTYDVIHAAMTDHRITKVPAVAADPMQTRAEPAALDPSVVLWPYAWRKNRRRLADEPDGQGRVYLAIAGARLGKMSAVDDLIDYTRNRRDALMPMVELADAFRRRGDVERELAVLQIIAEYHPDHVQANLDLAMAFAQSGDYEAALPYYRRSIAIGPRMPEAELGIGMVYLHRGDLEKAEEHFRAAIELRPLYAEAHLNLGILLFNQRRWMASCSALMRARAIDPTLGEVDAYLERLGQPR